MLPKIMPALLMFFAFFIIAGCSSQSSPTTPAETSLSGQPLVGVSERFPDGSPASGMGALGIFDLSVNADEISAELTPIRQNSLTDVLEVVDITNFLMMAPCSDCAKIGSISIDADGNLVVSIGIRHPFAAGDPLKPISGKNRGDLHVFNVEGTIVSNTAGTSFPGLGNATAGFALVNADGYTPYLDSVLDDIYPTDATVHPYILHFDDYTTGNYDASNPMGFESVTDPPPSGNLVMAMDCDYDYQDYIFNIDGAFDFIYAVGCTYAVSSQSKNARFTPEYRVPQHNKKAASEVSVEIITNDLAEGEIASTADIEIHVVDVSHGVAVGTNLDEMFADSSVGGITMEVPGVEASPVIVDVSSPTGSGHDPSDPLVYAATIANTASGVEGAYTGLVKVVDSYSTGLNESPLLGGMDGIKRVGPIENPLTGLFAIDEFATYQIFDVIVQEPPGYIEILIPNGGEEWSGNTHHDITWTDSGDIGFVDIYYSKDDFVSETITIIEDYVNTGTYYWIVPDDPSTTVKVKVVESGGTFEDTSDDCCTIIEVPEDPGWLQGYFNSTNYNWNLSSTIELPLTEVWSASMTRICYRPPIVKGDQLWITASDGYLLSHDATDGSFLWEQDIKTSGSFWAGCNPLIWGDKVIEGGNGIFCFDAATGAGPDWTFMEGSDFLHMGGVIVGDTCYWRSCHNRFYSIDLTTGTENWSASGSTFPLFNPGANDDYVVYPSSYSVTCCTTSGSFNWSMNVGGYFYGGPLILEDKVYFGYNDLRCVDLATGNIEWTTSYDSGYTFIRSLVLADDKIVTMTRIGSNPMRLYCFDLNGNLQWTHDLGLCMTTGTYSNGYYFCTGQDQGSSAYQLIAIDMMDGTTAQTIGSFQNYWGGVTCTNDRLYFADNQMHLYCYE
jgi:outer membrane protein assembly factor BamB